MVEKKSPVIETIIRESFKEGKKSVTKKKVKKKTQRILKKPQAKGIQKLSATKLIQQMGKESSGVLVREVENPYVDPVQDNRSQFFRENFQVEKRKAFGGFL